MRVRLMLCVVVGLAAVACETPYEKDMNARGVKYEDRFILLRDAAGRCIQLDRHLDVSGNEYFQSGYMTAREIADNECRHLVEAPR